MRAAYVVGSLEINPPERERERGRGRKSERDGESYIYVYIKECRAEAA